jgi:hypothetical protein
VEFSCFSVTIRTATLGSERSRKYESGILKKRLPQMELKSQASWMLDEYNKVIEAFQHGVIFQKSFL